MISGEQGGDSRRIGYPVPESGRLAVQGERDGVNSLAVLLNGDS